jgi:hypothetical protein
MKLWIEITKLQNSIREVILKETSNFTTLQTLKKEEKRLLKSNEFLNSFLSSVFSLNSLSDISLYYFLNTFDLITSLRNGHFTDQQLNLFVFIIEKNSEKFDFWNSENSKILVRILNFVGENFKAKCTLQGAKAIFGILKNFWELGKFEEPKVANLMLKFMMDFEEEEKFRDEDVMEKLEIFMGKFYKGILGNNKIGFEYWLNKLWMMYFKRDVIVELVASNFELLLNWSFEVGENVRNIGNG